MEKGREREWEAGRERGRGMEGWRGEGEQITDGWRVVAGLGSGSRQGKAVTSHARHRVTIYLPRRSLNTESPAG